MTADRLKIIGAVLRKDLQIYWLLAALVALLAVALPVCIAVGGRPAKGLTDLLSLIELFAAEFLAIAVVQQDAIASDRDDWLTRPIRHLDLLVAKSLFVLVVVFVPLSLGDAAAHLAAGRPLDVVLHGFAQGWVVSILAIPVLLAFAGLTGTIGRAIIGAIVAVVLMVAISAGAIFNLIQGAPVFWIAALPVGVAVLALSFLAIWLAYGRRAVTSARVVFAGGFTVLVALMVNVPAHALFVAQQALSGNAAAGGTVRLALAPGCFAASTLNTLPTAISNASARPDFTVRQVQTTEGPVHRYTPDIWTPGQRRRAGPDPVAFRTHVIVSGSPAGERLVVDDVQATYVDADGRALGSPIHGRQLGAVFGDAVFSPDLEDAWLTPGRDAARLSGARLRLDYDLTLLKPVATHSLPADGQTRYVAGLGYCSVGGVVTPAGRRIDCLMPGPAPALMTARITGGPETHGVASYRPGWLFSGGDLYRLFASTSSSAPTPVAALTAYQVAAHFSRRVFAAPGMTGGPAASCTIEGARHG